MFKVSINLTIYLNYLLNTFKSLGGTMQRINISHLNKCIDIETDIMINCLGIHAGTLGGIEDLNVYSAQGQVVVLQLPQLYMNWAFYLRDNIFM